MSAAAETPEGAALPGRATPKATAQVAAATDTAGFYRPGWDGLTCASLGLGTYLGEPDADTDARYGAALRRYWRNGGNLVDSAINYRFQRSERVIGAALRATVAAGEAAREALIVCTKGGYLSFDGEWPTDPNAWVRKTFIETKIAQPDEIVDGHCLAPGYLRHQIAQSRANLGVACIDLYYLHNPEGQRAALGDAAFRERLREALATLEVAVAQGHIAAYGLATWNGFRAKPSEPEYLSVEAVLEAARDVAGDRHHLRVIQLPLNFQMLEAVGRANQPGERSLLEAAAEHGVSVLASAPLLQARVLGRLPASRQSRFAPGITDAQRALQFVRSLPGVTAALAGMARPDHVDENLALRRYPPLTAEEVKMFFG
ncbi:MAG: aldo/keto reductase [Anaerolineales bacterium]|nr:aldo/keto reductase [Anaerolineales bacterium]